MTLKILIELKISRKVENYFTEGEKIVLTKIIKRRGKNSKSEVFTTQNYLVVNVEVIALLKHKGENILISNTELAENLMVT